MQSVANRQNIKVHAFKCLFVPFSKVTLTVSQGEYESGVRVGWTTGSATQCRTPADSINRQRVEERTGGLWGVRRPAGRV